MFPGRPIARPEPVSKLPALFWCIFVWVVELPIAALTALFAGAGAIAPTGHAASAADGFLGMLVIMWPIICLVAPIFALVLPTGRRHRIGWLLLASTALWPCAIFGLYALLTAMGVSVS
jgi:hypothetical protein